MAYFTRSYYIWEAHLCSWVLQWLILSIAMLCSCAESTIIYLPIPLSIATLGSSQFGAAMNRSVLNIESLASTQNFGIYKMFSLTFSVL